MNTQETIALFEKYVIANYSRLPIAIVRGQGSHVWDAEGRRYLDLFPGWGVDGLGHCHPRVVRAVQEQAERLFHVANNFYIPPQGVLARHIAEKGFGGKSFFCNSGAEAVEGAIKLARLHFKGERDTVITMENSFHGRTFAALTATGQDKYHQGVGRLLPGFKYCPFNDLAAVEAAVDESVCAVLLEPVQGEGGIHIATPEFLLGLRKLCDAHGILLIFDEVQCAPGRTGRWFAHQHYGVTPDIMTLAKMLGGGLAIGALCATEEVARSLVPGTHASTFGGNPIACAGAIATFEAIEAEGLLDRASAIGRRFRDHLGRFADRFDFVREVRVLGCMVALELDRAGTPIVDRCIENGLFINCTHETVLRMLPAMTVSDEEIDEGMAILEKALEAED